MLQVLERSLKRLMDGVRADWALYVKFTATGDEININADAPMDTMSVIKIPLLVALFRLVEAGKLDLSAPLHAVDGLQTLGHGHPQRYG